MLSKKEFIIKRIKEFYSQNHSFSGLKYILTGILDPGPDYDKEYEEYKKQISTND